MSRDETRIRETALEAINSICEFNELPEGEPYDSESTLAMVELAIRLRDKQHAAEMEKHDQEVAAATWREAATLARQSEALPAIPGQNLSNHRGWASASRAIAEMLEARATPVPPVAAPVAGTGEERAALVAGRRAAEEATVVANRAWDKARACLEVALADLAEVERMLRAHRYGGFVSDIIDWFGSRPSILSRAEKPASAPPEDKEPQR